MSVTPEQEPNDITCVGNFARCPDNGCEMVSTEEQEPAPVSPDY